MVREYHKKITDKLNLHYKGVLIILDGLDIFNHQQRFKMMSLFCVQYESTTPPTGYRRILYCCFGEKSNIAMATEKGNKTCRYGIFTALFPQKVSILAYFIGSVAFHINFSCQIYTVVSNYWYLSWFWHQH